MPPMPWPATGVSERLFAQPWPEIRRLWGSELGEVSDPMDSNVDVLLKQAVNHGASDIHLKVGSAPIVRIDGEMLR